MEWPTQFLAAVLGLGIVALFIPWLVPRGFSVLLGLILALAATGCWGAYERHLQSIARPGDPLIRVDLILIVPLIALTWLSLLGLTVVRGRDLLEDVVGPACATPVMGLQSLCWSPPRMFLMIGTPVRVWCRAAGASDVAP
jgi:hypothetical protein